jgi:hypothetical protein
MLDLRSVEVDNLGFIREMRHIFNVITAWGKNLSHRCMGKALSVEQMPAIKWSLNDLIALSAAYILWMYGGTS